MWTYLRIPSFLHSARNCTLLMAVCAVFFVFFQLGSGSLYPWDEGLTALRSLAMFENGFSFTVSTYPSLSPDFNKPPLYYWLVAACFKFWGVTLFSVRLPSALFGLGCFVLAGVLGKELTKSPWGGVFAVFCLLLNSHWLDYTRIGMLETAVAFFPLAALFVACYCRWHHTLWGAVAAAFLLSLAAWVKQPVYGILLVLFYAHWHFVDKNPRALRQLLVATVTFLVIGFAWYAIEFILWGQKFFDFFFRHNISTRFFEGSDGRNRSVLYFAQPLSRYCLMAFLLYIVSFFAAISRWRKGDRTYCVTLATTTLLFVAMLCMASKRRSYLASWYPFMVVCAAVGGQWVLSAFQPYRAKAMQFFMQGRAAAVVHTLAFRSGVLGVLVLWNAYSFIWFDFVPDYSPEFRDIRVYLEKRQDVAIPIMSFSNENFVLYFDMKEQTPPVAVINSLAPAIARVQQGQVVRVITRDKKRGNSVETDALLQGVAGVVVTEELQTHDLRLFLLAPEHL